MLWERLLQGPFRRAVLSGAEAEAGRISPRELAGRASAGAGRVALIGCGPGDPDLLTLKALQRLQEADVLVVDRLVDPEILDYARRDAERIFVGKTPGGPTTSQAEINRILVREAPAGKVVARLKGGDPFIFGRAAEEMAALQAAGIAVEVVPGVTAAHACAARIGLPVTLRERVRHFSVVTGATADGAPDLDWQRARRARGHGIRRVHGRRQRAAAALPPARRRRRSRHARRHRRERHARGRARLRHHARRPDRLRRRPGDRRPRRDLRRPRLGRRPALAARDRRSSIAASAASADRDCDDVDRHTRRPSMSKPAPQISVLTANRLGDGIVVFLDFEGAWSESIAEAVVARSPDEVRGARRSAAPTTRRATWWSSPIWSRCARPAAA